MDATIKNLTIIDAASGTGDIAKLCSMKNQNQSKIYCVEPNEKMLQIGKNKPSYLENLEWVKSSAEKLPFKIIILIFMLLVSGIRNVFDIHKTLQENI